MANAAFAAAEPQESVRGRARARTGGHPRGRACRSGARERASGERSERAKDAGWQAAVVGDGAGRARRSHIGASFGPPVRCWGWGGTRQVNWKAVSSPSQGLERIFPARSQPGTARTMPPTPGRAFGERGGGDPREPVSGLAQSEAGRRAAECSAAAAFGAGEGRRQLKGERGEAWPGLLRSLPATAGWMLRYCGGDSSLYPGGADQEWWGGGRGSLRPPSREQEASAGPLPPRLPNRRRSSSSSGCHFGEQGPGGFA